MKSKNMDFTIVMLNGIAHSGTTFTASVFNSLPNSLFFLETFRLPNYYHMANSNFNYPVNLSEINMDSNIDFLEVIPSYSSFEINCVSPTLSNLGDLEKESVIKAQLKEKVDRENAISYIRAFELFYKTISEEYQVSVVGGKTTFCHAYKNYMLLNIPNLKWIEVVRDVRGVISSGILSHFKIDDPWSFLWWKEQAKSIEKLPSSIKDRYLLIKYEDLILEKEKTIQKVVNFLGIKNFNYIKWDKKPILKNNGIPFGMFSSYDEYGKPMKKAIYMGGKSFDSKPLERWKSFFSKSQKWFLTEMYKKELEFFNYPIKKDYPKNPFIYLTYLIMRFWKYLICNIRFRPKNNLMKQIIRYTNIFLKHLINFSMKNR